MPEMRAFNSAFLILLGGESGDQHERLRTDKGTHLKWNEELPKTLKLFKWSTI